MVLVLDTIKEKYMALIPSYNLKIENYREKHNLLTLNLSSDVWLQD